MEVENENMALLCLKWIGSNQNFPRQVRFLNEAGLLLIEHEEWEAGVNAFFLAVGMRIWPFLHEDIITCLSVVMGATCRICLRGEEK